MQGERVSSRAELGSYLRVERKERGWTLREAGEATGLDATTLWRIEAGKDFVISHLFLLLAGYGLSFDLSRLSEKPKEWEAE